MSVRNFFVTTHIDGRETPLEGGPRSKDGGFRTRISIRSDGGIMQALFIAGETLPGGQLRLSVWAGDELVHQIEVQR